MGMFWNYSSFPRERWESVFGGGANAEKQVVASYMWYRLDGTEPDLDPDSDEWLNAVVSQAPTRITQLAGELCRKGFSYENRSKDEAATLDSMVTGFFCPEGIEDLLEAEVVGGDGIKPFVLEELLSRGKGERRGGFLGIGGTTVPSIATQLAQFLVSGRRINSRDPPTSENQYVVFWEDEVPRVRAEVELLLQRQKPWSHAEFEQELRSNVLAALVAAESSRRCLFGRYC